MCFICSDNIILLPTKTPRIFSFVVDWRATSLYLRIRLLISCYEHYFGLAEFRTFLLFLHRMCSLFKLCYLNISSCWTSINKANSSGAEAPFYDLNLSISNGTVSTKIYDKREEFDFDIFNFPFLVGDVPRRTSYGVYISQLIRFARASSNVSDLNCRNKAIIAKLLKQGYRYHKLRKAFF